MNAVERIVDRKRGALVGLAVGDALGAAVEFKSPGTFPKVTGYRAGGPHHLAAGEWTDDTSMALALADSLARAGWDSKDQMQRYVAWWKKGEYSVNGKCFDIGNATRAALSRFQQHPDPTKSGDPSESASGNGSIMRLAPVPIRYADLYPDSLDKLIALLVESSLPTHASPQCKSACAYFGLVLAALIHGQDRDEVLAPDWSPLAKLKKLFPLHPEIAAVADGSFRDKQPPQIKGSGYVVKSLEAALWAFHDAKDFREAVLRAVNLGDDADTTAAVCGQLAGAYWGESGIPSQWRKDLARMDMIEKALSGILRPIRAVLLPPIPKFVGTHKHENEAVAHQAFQLALGGDVAALKAVKLPASDKLVEWHQQLVDELKMQIATPFPWTPPTRCSYWVEPGRLLAGAYPGDVDDELHAKKLHALTAAGVSVIVNLMHEGETNRDGKPFRPYEDQVRKHCPEAEFIRLPIIDNSVPDKVELAKTLNVIDQFLAAGKTIYVHCWGGVGRTGTVIACWLLRHGRAQGSTVIETLQTLRQQDRERGYRESPQTHAQREFVVTWSEPEIEGDGSDFKPVGDAEGTEYTATWEGITRLETLNKWAADALTELADAAKSYDWPKVFRVLAEHPKFVNSSRPGGKSLYAPLHQAAHGGASPDVIRRLLDLGAWRTLQNACGERPVDVAARKQHTHLLPLLEPEYKRHVPHGILARLQAHFHAVIRERADQLVQEHALRLPELESLLELATPRMWFAIPGMYGGFHFWLESAGVEPKLVAESWCRVAGGSGQRHEITPVESRLVAEGFV